MTTINSTPVTWQHIAECLRAELAEYGGLLALFENQQTSLFRRDANEVLRLSAEIEQQARTLQYSRRQREDTVAGFAILHGQSAGSTLRSLLPFVALEARPLLEALIDEVNRLIHRVRRVSRHNHTLLTRTVDLHQEILRSIRPDTFTQTYTPKGRLALGNVPVAPAWQAAG